jgi:flavin-binding protein dodecin
MNPSYLGVLTITIDGSIFKPRLRKENTMSGSVYKIITLVGTSTESWEKAAAAAVETAAKKLQDLRIAEVEQLDMHIENGKVMNYRARVRVSFKYHGKEM